MKQNQRPASPSQQDQKQPKDRTEKTVGTAHERDPRAELGLKSPTKEAEGQKATQFDGNPNPQAAPSSPLKPKDDTPVPLGKESRNDQ